MTAHRSPAPASLPRRRLLAAVATSLAPSPRPAWAAGGEIVVGQVASLSGSNGADLGQGLRSGVEACFRAVNAAGGVSGRTLRLISKDDRYLPNETVDLTRELIRHARPVALIGYRGTANTLALIKSGLLVQHRITLVGTLTGAREVQGAAGVLHLRTSYERELTELVLQIQRMMLDRIAVLYVDDAFGRTGLAAVQEAAAASGSGIVLAEPYDKAADKVAASIAGAAHRIAQAGAKAVVLVAVGDPAYTFIQAFKPLSPATRIFCMSVVDPAAVVRRCGADMAAGIGFSQVFPFPYSDKTVLARDYRSALARLPEAPAPTYFGLEGYVYARVLVEALRRASNALVAAGVTAALDALPPLDLGGLRVQVDPSTRNGLRYTDLTVLDRNGRLLH